VAVKVYFDTEFIEDGRTIDLLSIGVVREDGATYYAEASETDRGRASEWVRENVLPSLTGPVKPRFVGDSPEFWAWFADYDWVALCQLYGTMMDLPTGWPYSRTSSAMAAYYCRDFKQVCDERGLEVSQDDSAHNALGDALWLASAMDRWGWR
jgi:hypothetical protein